MKNILVAIDFSSFSPAAMKAAAFIARRNGAVVHLLHVAQAPADWNGLSVKAQQRYPEVEHRMIEAEKRLEALAADGLLKDCEVRTHVKGGIAYEHITGFAKAYSMNLIIIGAHGADERGAMFIGSTTQRVIRAAECPVLSLKRHTHIKAIRRILFPSDFEENISRVVDFLKDFAGTMGASVDFLTVNSPSTFNSTEEAEKKMEKFIPVQKQVRFHSFIYNDYDRERGILAFVKRRKPDMLVMITHARKGKPVYMVSVTDTLLFNTDVPVLSIVLKKT